MNINPDRTSTHETWLAASWLFADEKAFNKWTEIAEQLVNASKVAELMPEQMLASKIQDAYTKELDQSVKGAGLFYDLLSNALHHVQWQEVAQLVIESYEVTDDA